MLEENESRASKDFYDLLAKAQHNLISQKCFNELEEGVIENIDIENQKKIKEALLECKHNMSAACFMFDEITRKKKTPLPKYYQSYKSNKCDEEIKEKEIISIEDIARKAALIDKESLQFLLFSLNTLPSYFSFLLTDQFSSMFFKFIELFVDDEVRFTEFSRFLFLLPFTMKFIHYSFKPLFTRVANARTRVTDPKQFVADVYDMFKKNIEILPDFVVKAMNIYYSKNSHQRGSFIYNSFFKYLIMCPHIYCAVNSYQAYLPPDLFSNLDDEFLSRSADFEELISSKEILINKARVKMENILQEYLNYRVFDSLDELLLDSMASTDENQFKKKLYKINFHNELNYKISLISYSCDATKNITKCNEVEKDQIMKNFIDLLLIAPPVHSLFENTENISFKELVYKNLVLKGSIKELPNRIQYYNKIKDDYMLNSASYSEFEDFIFEVVKRDETINSSIHSKVIYLIYNLFNDIKTCQEQPTCLFAYLLFNYAGFDPAPSISEIINNQEMFKQKLFERFHQVHRSELNFLQDKVLIYQLLAENFNFHSYLSNRQNLVEIDQIVHDFIEQNKEELYNAILYDTSIMKQLHSDELFAKVITDIKSLATDSDDAVDFYKKNNMITDEFSKIANKLYQNDYDMKEALSYIIIIKANPMHLFSMSAFCNEYLYLNNLLQFDSELPKQNTLLNFSYKFSNIITIFNSSKLNYCIYDYLVTNHIRINVALCGKMEGFKSYFINLVAPDNESNTFEAEMKVNDVFNFSHFICPTFYSFESAREMEKSKVRFELVLVFPSAWKHAKSFAACLSYPMIFMLNQDKSLFGDKIPTNVDFQDVNENRSAPYYFEHLLRYYKEYRNAQMNSI